VVAIVALGSLLGVALGDWLGAQFIGLYAEVFHLPRFVHRLDPALVELSVGITLATAVLARCRRSWPPCG